MSHVLGILSTRKRSAQSAAEEEYIMATYLELLEKIQAQTLENLKQIQAVQLATLNTAREVAASLPSLANIPSVPTIEGLPTLAQVAELNTTFATQLLDQQKSFASQLAEIFTPAKASSN
jgi:hypothetical protein